MIQRWVPMCQTNINSTYTALLQWWLHHSSSFEVNAWSFCSLRRRPKTSTNWWVPHRWVGTDLNLMKKITKRSFCCWRKGHLTRLFMGHAWSEFWFLKWFVSNSQWSLPGGFDEARSDGSFGYATHISEVNVFFPSQPSTSICSKLSPAPTERVVQNPKYGIDWTGICCSNTYIWRNYIQHDHSTENDTRPCTSGSFDLEVRKRHPLFAKCQAQVSLLGEGKSLVFLGNLDTDSVRHRTPLDCYLRIPAGWWWTAISTQPSVTLHHTYWSFENRHWENHCDPPFFTGRKKKKKNTRPAVGYTWWIWGYDESYVGEIAVEEYTIPLSALHTSPIQGILFWQHPEAGLCGSTVGSLWITTNFRRCTSSNKTGRRGRITKGWTMLCNSLTQQVDVINVMSLGTEWEDGIVLYTPMMFCESLVLFALSPSPDMCFQDPTVLVHWHFPSVGRHGMIDTPSPWHVGGASIIAVNSPTI